MVMYWILRPLKVLLNDLKIIRCPKYIRAKSLSTLRKSKKIQKNLHKIAFLSLKCPKKITGGWQ
jgi:hypothetical protein